MEKVEKKQKDKDKKKGKDKEKSKDKSKSSSPATAPARNSSTSTTAPKKYTIVVFDGNPMHRWDDLFGTQTLADGSTLRIVQCSWMDCEVCVYGDQSGSLRPVYSLLCLTLGFCVFRVFVICCPSQRLGWCCHKAEHVLREA